MKIDLEISVLNWSHAMLKLFLFLKFNADKNEKTETTLCEISQATGLSVQSIRTMLKNLQLTRKLTYESTRQGIAISTKLKKANTQTNTQINTQKLIGIFSEYYLKTTDHKFLWDGKQTGSIKKLGLKLRSFALSKGLPDTDEQLETSFKLILVNIKDKWMLDNLSPAMINSKINEIIKQIKNGQSKSIGEKRADALKIMCS